ncbi:MAG: transglycosylase SLT domain-containing protein [Nitrospirota bacterium]
MQKKRSLISLFLILAVLSSALITSAGPPKNSTVLKTPEVESANPLVKGKQSLESGDFDSAVTYLSTAYEQFPLLGDYALLWRAQAYEKKGDPDKALSDMRLIKEKYKESPLIKNLKLKELELLVAKKDPSLALAYESFIKDNPSNMEVKFSYATYLKERKEKQKARDLFKEVYLTVCPLSARAHDELSPADITIEDLIKRGKNLNNASLFEESEKVFWEALKKSSGPIRDEATEGLAYSLFRQKRYKEAAELYKQVKNGYWRARSIYRAGDMETLETELPELLKTGDKRVASLLIAYGTKKRREGKIDEALTIFNNAAARYPSAREEALWTIGWTHYLSRDYRRALSVLSELYTTYGDPKYLYWSNKCKTLLGETELLAPSLNKRQDFYTFLSHLKNNQALPPLEKASLNLSLKSFHTERAEMLEKLGFIQEATAELLQMSKKNPAPNDLVYISAALKRLGNYKMAMNIISRVPYSEELHELYYPFVYWQEVEESSRGKGIDPYLVLSVMREESRFAPDARSIAGALGLMQMMPQTAQRLNKSVKVALRHSSDLYDPKTNILLGSHYLSNLITKFGSLPLAIAAYNGGEDAVNEWLQKGSYRTIDEFIEDIPYDETRNYVKKVLTSYFEYLRTRNDNDLTLTRKYLGDL